MKSRSLRNDPKAIKAFYMQVNGDSRTVAAMEMLAPGIGEIIGDSQGITRNYGAGLELRGQFTRQ